MQYIVYKAEQLLGFFAFINEKITRYIDIIFFK